MHVPLLDLCGRAEDDMRSYLKLETNCMEFQLQSVDVGEILREAL